MDPGDFSKALQAWYYDWTHGWHGLLALYLLIAAYSLAGLRRARAGFAQFFAWPFTSVVTGVLVALALEFASWLAESFWGVKQDSSGETLILIVFTMAGGYFGGLYWARKGLSAGPIAGRGAMVMDGAPAQRATRKVKARALRKPGAIPPITLAGVAIPAKDELTHFKLVGTTGTGKSTLMREILDAALTRGDRAVIADPDGGYLSRFYRPERGDVILNPFDRRSAQWNLFAELRNPYDIDQLARAMIPDRAVADPTWINYARTFLGAVTRQMQQAGITDIGELYRLITAAPRDELRPLVAGTPAAPFLEDGVERLFGGARSTATEHVKTLDYIRVQRGKPFSVRDWILSGNGVLFLPYKADQIAALKSIISTWMRIAIFQTMGLGEGDCRIWFSVDELDALGPIDGLSDALPRLRKFGGRCALGLQSISQVSTTYGQGLAQTMVENCGNTVLQRCSASENGGTARFASRLIGEREITRLAHSVSRSSGFSLNSDRETQGHSEQYATELAVLAAEIEQLPDRSGFLKVPSQPAWLRVNFPYHDLPKIAEPFLPASHP